jgi:membrane protease YdiL (CAAX protease family)
MIFDSNAEKLAFAASPGLSAIFCTAAFERGRWREALGLKFHPNIWWLWAALIPLLIVFASIALTLLLSSIPTVEMDAVAAESVRFLGLPADRALSGIPGKIALNLVGYSILFTLLEELGWRGYIVWLSQGKDRNRIETLPTG